MNIPAYYKAMESATDQFFLDPDSKNATLDYMTGGFILGNSPSECSMKQIFITLIKVCCYQIHGFLCTTSSFSHSGYETCGVVACGAIDMHLTSAADMPQGFQAFAQYGLSSWRGIILKQADFFDDGRASFHTNVGIAGEVIEYLDVALKIDASCWEVFGREDEVHSLIIRPGAVDHLDAHCEWRVGAVEIFPVHDRDSAVLDFVCHVLIE